MIEMKPANQIQSDQLPENLEYILSDTVAVLEEVKQIDINKLKNNVNGSLQTGILTGN